MRLRVGDRVHVELYVSAIHENGIATVRHNDCVFEAGKLELQANDPAIVKITREEFQVGDKIRLLESDQVLEIVGPKRTCIRYGSEHVEYACWRPDYGYDILDVTDVVNAEIVE